MQLLPMSGTVKTPASNFTGDVYLNVVAGQDDIPLNGGLVRFTPGARTNWHSHTHGQLLICTDGVGLVVTRAGDPVVLRAGDSVWAAPGEEHWHGGTAENLMCHYAIVPETAERDATTWLEPVSDQDYDAAQRALDT